tara:strand:+ start:2153 stop:2449 length:297 start_codon:yes stop_codon:yes gene_type:complete
MAIYKSFSGDQDNVVLIQKNSGRSGGISKILISNTHDSATQTTSLNLFDGSTTYVLYNKIDIPAKTSLVLTDNISFDNTVFSLRLKTTGSSSCDIVIK